MILTFIIIISLFSVEPDNILGLTSENLVLLALKDSPERVESHLNHLLNEKLVASSSDQRATVKSGLRRQIEEQLNNINAIQAFRVSKQLKLVTERGRRDKVQVRGLFQSPVFTILRKQEKHDFLPHYFFLLIANYNILQSVSVSNRENKLPGDENTMEVYADVTLKISDYQNNSGFQVVISHIDFYKDQSRDNLLFSFNEEREYSGIVKNWFLSDGISNPNAGIHAFSLFNHRLQDIVPVSYIFSDVCERGKNINKHRVYVCENPLSENINFEAIFIGGKLGVFQILASNAVSDIEIKRVISGLSRGLKKRADYFSGEKQWTNYSVNFKFDDSGTGDIVNEKRVIFSMIPSGTQKILEDDLNISW